MAYPQGGGAYIVARENLGMIPSLVAAAPLLVSYVLTVAVSMSAAVAAITSAIKVLEPYRIEMAIGLIALVTLANLRGLKESGRLFAIPTYLFIVSMFVLIGLALSNSSWARSSRHRHRLCRISWPRRSRSRSFCCSMPLRRAVPR
jgi:amino acid transporter